MYYLEVFVDFAVIAVTLLVGHQGYHETKQSSNVGELSNSRKRQV